MLNGVRETPGEELSRRIETLSEKQGHPWPPETRWELQINGMKVHLRPRFVAVWLNRRRSDPVYCEKPVGTVLLVHDEGIDRCVRILREHMVLDDLANV